MANEGLAAPGLDRRHVLHGRGPPQPPRGHDRPYYFSRWRSTQTSCTAGRGATLSPSSTRTTKQPSTPSPAATTTRPRPTTGGGNTGHGGHWRRLQCPSAPFENDTDPPSAFRRRRESHSVLGKRPPPPNVRAVHFFCHLFARRHLQTHPRFRFLVRLWAAGRPSRPPGAGLEVSETALQTDNCRRDTALQICSRPLIHSTVGTVPVGFVPSHRQRRERKTMAET